MDADGRTYHLGTRRGEVANRILSVGSEKRALMLAEYLQPPAPRRGLFMLESSRGFLTITGALGWPPHPVKMLAAQALWIALVCTAAPRLPG